MNTQVGKFFNRIAKKESKLTVPELILLGGTRALLGVGVGLLIADKINNNPRKAAGLSLFLVGALSTIPIGLNIFAKSK